MSLKELRSALIDLASFAHAAGGARAAADIRKIEQILNGDESTSAATALEELSNLIAEHKATVQNEYIANLIESGADVTKFEEIHSLISQDERLDKADLDIIAHGYTRGRTKYKSRATALSSIRDRFEERAYQASKMKIVDQYKVG